MKRISIYVSEPQHAGFHALGQRRGLKASELMRQALDEYLERHGVVNASGKTKAARQRAQTRRRA
jgi:hypothetical protein